MNVVETTASDTVHVSLLQVLGQGGFGKVFLADVQANQAFKQRMAVKVLHPEYQQHPQILARQLDEARMLGLLNHRNIVQVIDICSIEGQTSILMEYVEGISLTTMLKQSPVPWGVAWQLISDCASALDAAFHARDPQTGRELHLIHRDIKPSNMVLSKSGTLKLLDFGIAKMDGVRESKTSTHQMGTQRYMAPEQWLENRSSSAVDVYALGRTLLELLLGRMLPRTPLDQRLHHEAVVQYLTEIPCEGVPALLLDVGRNLLFEMLSYQDTDRPSISAVFDRSLAIAEAAGESSLSRFAQHCMQMDASQASSEHKVERTLHKDVIQGELSGQHVTQTLESTTLSMQVYSLSEETPVTQSEPHVQSHQSQIRFSNRVWMVLLALCVVGLGLFSIQPSTPNDVDTLMEQADSRASQVVERNNNFEKEDPGSDEISADATGLDSETQQMRVESTDFIGTELQGATPLAQVTKKSTKSTKKSKTVVQQSTVILSSVPLGAEVYIDGKHVGRTLLTGQKLNHGTHRIEMHFADQIIQKRIDVEGEGRYVWRIDTSGGEGTWLSY